MSSSLISPAGALANLINSFNLQEATGAEVQKRLFELHLTKLVNEVVQTILEKIPQYPTPKELYDTEMNSGGREFVSAAVMPKGSREFKVLDKVMGFVAPMLFRQLNAPMPGEKTTGMWLLEEIHKAAVEHYTGQGIDGIPMYGEVSKAFGAGYEEWIASVVIPPTLGFIHEMDEKYPGKIDQMIDQPVRLV